VETHEFFGEFVKPFEMSVSMTILHRDIAAFVIPLLMQSLEEVLRGINTERARNAARKEHADERHRARLCEGCYHPRSQGTPKQRQDATPVYGLHR
jgi:hypothetical protein